MTKTYLCNPNFIYFGAGDTILALKNIIWKTSPFKAYLATCMHLHVEWLSKTRPMVAWSVGDRLALSKNHALHLFRLLGWRLVGLVGLVDCTGWCLLEAVSCMRCERGATWLWKWRNILGFVSHIVWLVRNKRKLTILPRPDCALLWSVCKPGVEPPQTWEIPFYHLSCS
jgi:hypothetical protein